jgi:cell division septation protein DedD
VDTADASVAASASVQVRVPAVREAQLSVAQAPPSVAAGQRYTAEFTLTNEGNVPLRPTLRAESNQSVPLTVETPVDTLSPQDTERLRVRARPGRVDEAFEHRIRLRVGLSPGDTTLTAGATTEVIPSGEGGGGLFSGPRYPTTVQVEAFGNQAAQGGQVEIDGQGALVRDADHTVDMFVRTPDQSGGTRFGRRSQYRLSYASSAWTVRVGDHTFERTRLAERGRRGMGGEVRYRTGDWTLGGYAFGNRFGASARQGSAYAQYEVHPRAQLTGNLVHNDGFLANGTLGTLRARITPWSRAQVDLEAGGGEGTDGWGGAYRAALRGNPTWGTYRLQHLRVEEAFPTTFNGGQRTSVALSADVSEHVGVSGSVRRSERNRAFDRTFESTTARLGSTVRGRWAAARWSLGADAALDRRPLRNEESVRLQGGVQTNRIGVRPTVEVGRFAPNEQAAGRSYRTYGLRASAQVGRQRVGGSIEYTEAAFREGFSRRPRWSADLSTQLQLSEAADLRLRGRWTEEGPFLPRRRSAQAAFSYQLPGGHVLSMEARYRSFEEGQSESRFRVGYTVPVGLPIVATPERERLTGRVVDAETNAPLSGVRVQLGASRRLTGADGTFSLPVPQDRPSYLRLDLSSAGLNRVPMLNLPMRITPEEKVSELVIPVSEESILHARVVNYEYATARAALEGEDPEPVGGLAGVVLEATDGTGTVRRLTGTQGDATFDGLRPGTWTVRVREAGLPPDRAPEQSAYEVSLSPGERDTLRVRMLPEGRPRIEVEEGGELRRGEAPAADDAPDPQAETPAAADPTRAVPIDVVAGPFVVQVGPYQEWGEALEAARQIRADHPFVTIQSRKKNESLQYEVWVGRYRDRRAAEQGREAVPAAVSEARVAEAVVPAPYAVRLGGFLDWDEAIQRAERIRESGTSVAVHPNEWQGQVMYRVWAGPYADRGTAAQALDTLARGGADAHVVQAVAQAAYTVQVGVFWEENRAARLAGQLREEGTDAYIQSGEINGETVYRVMVGVYTDWSVAKNKADARRADGQDALVRRMPIVGSAGTGAPPQNP